MHNNMLSSVNPLKKFQLLVSSLLLFRHLWRKPSYENQQTRHSIHKFQFLAEREDLSGQVLVFNVERALLRSSSLFPYFMLVAFEAGSLIRASVLLAFYPFIAMTNRDMGLKIMVLICFLGIKKDRFRTGRAVLPKFLLEDVGLESFNVIVRGGKRVGVTDLPRVMVESFLRDYMEIDFVVGRELKVFNGYFLGLMEKKHRFPVGKILGDDHNMVGISSFDDSLEHCHHLFSHCKEIYLTSEAEKRNWQRLPREMYPRPLIFHDGRLAFKPSFVPMLVTLMWLPVGLFLSVLRIALGLFPYKLAIPISSFTGIRMRLTKPKSRTKKEGRFYVCNHRTLLDPVFLSAVLQNPLRTVTYSLSRVSEILSPIKTVRLKRNREEDAKIMETLLSEGDVVVCPEGTTCREPYLLRFSPLFAELSDDIVPVAVEDRGSMFYGTTAGGLKCMDPFFFLMNPCPVYGFEFLDTVDGSVAAPAGGGRGLESRLEVANFVQSEIGKALGFQCTKLTRKDKYFFLTAP